MTASASTTTEPEAGHRVIAVLREAGGARPEVRLEDWDGLRVVVKDYTVRSTWVKLIVAGYLVKREAEAHRRLRDVEGIPPALPVTDPHIFAHVYVEGRSVPDVAEPLTPEFFDRLYQIVAAIHERAMAHGDLKRLPNILMQPDGMPALVDLSAAIMSGSNPIVAAILGYIQEDDLRAVAKLKKRQAPELLTEEEIERLAWRPLAERMWRWLRAYLRPWLQRRSDPDGELAGD
jgi:RIO-like serine/threonine protein kinase